MGSLLSRETFVDWLVDKYFPTHLKQKAFFTDKYLVKQYVKNNFNNVNIAKTLFVTKSPESLLYFDFPQKSVVKANHGSGMNIILTHKPDRAEVIDIIKKCKIFLKTEFYKIHEELHYKYIEPVIIIEEYLDNNGKSPIDYKFHTINGEIVFIQADLNRFGIHTTQILDSNWNKLNVSKGHYISHTGTLKKPDRFDEMMEISKKFYKLNPDLKYVRVDLYMLNNKIYFGEFTFTPGAGKTRFSPRSFEEEIYKKYIKK
jgi:hypothetical protein